MSRMSCDLIIFVVALELDSAGTVHIVGSPICGPIARRLGFFFITQLSEGMVTMSETGYLGTCGQQYQQQIYLITEIQGIRNK